MSMPAIAPHQAAQRAAEPSMEEILASIRKIIAEDQKALEEKAGGIVAAPLRVAPAVNDDVQPAHRVEAAAEPVEQPALEVAPAQAVAAPPTVQRVAHVEEAPMRIDIAGHVQQAAAPVVDDTPLLSQNAASATSAAFHSLTHVVATPQSRTMDELASDLLRPMLAAWLDDNLPALVERLVKAEIERVSRGAR